MMSASSGLRDLIVESMSIVEHSHHYRRVLLEHFQETICPHSLTETGNMHVDGGWRLSVAEHDRQTHEALVPDCSDLGSVSIFHCADEWADTDFYEIDVLDRPIGPIKRVSIWKRNGLKIGLKPLVIVLR
jgi:hypothetical protein